MWWKKYYKITKEKKINNEGITLYRIKAVRDFEKPRTFFEKIHKGEYGGWIEKKSNLAQDGSWIDINSSVFGNALIKSNSIVLSSKISGNTIINGSYVYECTMSDSSTYNRCKTITCNIHGGVSQFDDKELCNLHYSYINRTEPILEDYYFLNGYYKISKESKKILYQIEAAKSFKINIRESVTNWKSILINKGDLGGWIESEDNLAQDGSWIYKNSEVQGKIKVYNKSYIKACSLSSNVLISVDNSHFFKVNIPISNKKEINIVDSKITYSLLESCRFSEIKNEILTNIAPHYYIDKDRSRVNSEGVTLYQIRALKDLRGGIIKYSDYGGWIEKEENLEQDGKSWVYKNVEICGDSVVRNNSIVFGNSVLKGDVIVNRSCIISSKLSGKLEVFQSEFRDCELDCSEKTIIKDEIMWNKKINQISLDDYVDKLLIDKEKLKNYISKNLDTLKKL